MLRVLEVLRLIEKQTGMRGCARPLAVFLVPAAWSPAVVR